MRAASEKLIALLDANQFVMADLYTITTIQNDIYRYTNYDFDLIVAGELYRSDGPIISRDGITLSLGVEVDNLSITIDVTDEETFESLRIVQAFHNGQMDGARFKLERIFMDANTPTDTSAGTIKLFEGRIIEPEFDRNTIHASVASDLDELNVQMPRNLYQPSCSNTLFDHACGLNRGNYALETVIAAGSTASRILCDINQPQGWFTQGVIEFLEGGNKGLKRTIRLHELDVLLLTLPLLEDPEVGQRIKVYPGCDKRSETCQNRFNNFARFRGAPFIPIPETSV
ncbi:DUF2163 domain-containing protein [Acinetobacter baumannii]|uniref:DUF2163 domain-containing protein n=1 Tax=Acinetobacter baumannii TaxID=470 RepID=UPI000297B3F5|nr:DUF2163 domain-containing protein [Acinetobacter baumannii]HEM7794801.1 DUF2163 domain-containing protein [Acinetobacter nosocomialis]EKP61886.1 TIGR02218 family protein [Acinetobacter baumannii Naval-82]MBF6811348.1 DUF2163 domain-containing protein [Acinetobacter baumannii]MBF6899904.1 DUF2163 domain-containing protein [Acinetobacter baumannii]MBF6908085.1 DUF2163 domain-containing protein [Acinetobacter baumannii]